MFCSNSLALPDILSSLFQRQKAPSVYVNIFHAFYSYFWVSWMGRSINFGSGQVVGKNPYDIYDSSGYRWLLSDTFTVTDVLVTSTSIITYIFNLGE